MKIYIEGNIACGKSTLTRMLSQIFQDCEFVQEPIDEWLLIKDSNNVNILDHFYKETHTWAFPFQMTTFITRIKKISDIPKNKTAFIERSIFTDKHCFALNLYKTGYINEIEWKLYNDWFDWLSSVFHVQPNLFIYLKTTPEMCMNRLNKRSRNEEVTVSLNYLTQLHRLHEVWLSKMKNVITIDANQEFETDAIVFDRIVAEIKQKLL